MDREATRALCTKQAGKTAPAQVNAFGKIYFDNKNLRYLYPEQGTGRARKEKRCGGKQSTYSRHTYQLSLCICRYWAMVQQCVCVLRAPPDPPAQLLQLQPALLWSAIRAAGQGDIVPSWRGTVSACEPAHFIHCTSTFPTGIISIKPSALPCSPGPHPLGCLRYCSICEPAQARATSLSQSAKKTNGDSDRTDAPGGFDVLLSQATRSTCASASSERHTAPLENLSHFLATMGRHRVPDCQKRRAENRVGVSWCRTEALFARAWTQFGSDTLNGCWSPGFNLLFVSVPAF